MRWGGVILALFVVYHILDLTTGTLNPNGVHGAVHDNLVADFALDRWYVTIFYVAGRRGTGLPPPARAVERAADDRPLQRGHAATLKSVALGVAVVLTAGFLSVPFAVMTGLVS